MNKEKVKLNHKLGGSNFLISIYHLENYTWQGTVEWLDTGSKLSFRSELELLSLLNDAVQSIMKDNQKEDEILRKWDDVVHLNVIKGS